MKELLISVFLGSPISERLEIWGNLNFWLFANMENWRSVCFFQNEDAERVLVF